MWNVMEACAPIYTSTPVRNTAVLVRGPTDPLVWTERRTHVLLRNEPTKRSNGSLNDTLLYEKS